MESGTFRVVLAATIRIGYAEYSGSGEVAVLT